MWSSHYSVSRGGGGGGGVGTKKEKSKGRGREGRREGGEERSNSGILIVIQESRKETEVKKTKNV